MNGISFNQVAASIFAVLAVAHAYRAIQPFPIEIGALSLPQWASWISVAALGSLSIWGFYSRG
jgi:hypothetical protein